MCSQHIPSPGELTPPENPLRLPGSRTHASAGARPQDALLCDLPLPLRRKFYPLGYAVETHTNDAAILEAAQESFGHRNASRESGIPPIRIGVHAGDVSACPPEPTRRQYNHLYSLVADGDNQALLDLRSGTSFVWLSEAAARNRIYVRSHFLEKVVYLLLGASVVTDIHAACVGRNGKGILLCGDSGAGKSTLAYACARAGWIYTSDDTSYLINDSAFPRVIGHAHRVRFRPAARELFPELRQHELTERMEGKPSIEVPIAELPVRNTAAEAEVHAIAFLRRAPGAEASLTPLTAGTATRRLSAELFSAGEIRAQHIVNLGILSGLPAYELHYGNLADGIRILETLV